MVAASTPPPSDNMLQRRRRAQNVEAELRARLRQRFPGEAMHALIEEAVNAEYASFADARVTTFVPILVERRVAARLQTASLTLADEPVATTIAEASA